MIAVLAAGALLLLLKFYKRLRQDQPTDWEERHSTLVGTVTTILILGMLAIGASKDFPRIKRLAANALFFTVLLLAAAPWWLWLAIAVAIVFAWSNRRNRLRQEAIISLLLEIKEKLE